MDNWDIDTIFEIHVYARCVEYKFQKRVFVGMPQEDFDHMKELDYVRYQQMDELVVKGEFMNALFLTDDRFRPLYVEAWWANMLMTVPELQEALAMAWTSCHYPARTFGIRTSVDLFKAAGFISDRPGVELPTSDLVVYRGCRPDGYFSLSWTTDYERAKWFAKNYNSDGATVFRVEVPPQHILAMFSEREENEAVVNPWGMRRSTLAEVG